MSSITIHVNVADDKNLNITVFYWIIHYNENWTEKTQVFSECRCVSVLTEQAALSSSYGWGPTPPVCCSHTATRGHIPACSFNKTKAVICQRKTNTRCIGEWSIHEKIIPGQIHNHQILWHWIHLQLFQLCKQHVELFNIWVYKYTVCCTNYIYKKHNKS